VLRFGQPPLRLEILNQISGVRFEECYSKREVLAVKDVEIPVIGIEELIRNKKASARDKGLLDVNRLE